MKALKELYEYTTHAIAACDDAERALRDRGEYTEAFYYAGTSFGYRDLKYKILKLMQEQTQ